MAANDVIRLDDGWSFDSGQRMDEPPVVMSPVTPPVHRKRGNSMSQDWMPHKRDTRYRFYKNMSTNVVGEAVKFGGVAADATAVKAAVDAAMARMDATDTAEDALNTARPLETAADAAAQQILRTKVKNWKTLPGWAASGSEGTLELTGTSSTMDPLSHKSTIRLNLVPGGVRVDFTKKGVSAANIYMRVRGAGSFTKIAMVLESPYIDTTPLAKAGVPEVREYMVRGVLHDEEIGTDSNTVSITFAG
jgi:hypothetical protein